MAKIRGIDGLSLSDINAEIQNGAKFVTYSYCISIIVMSFKRSSDIFFIKNGESAFTKGLPYTLVSFILGWWGLPWGIIYTLTSLVSNLSGGKDITQEVLQHFMNSVQQNIEIDLDGDGDKE
jgi:hypothetical protein